jgi:hypothetical protein
MVLCCAAGWHRFVLESANILMQVFMGRQDKSTLSFIENADVRRSVLQSCSMPNPIKQLLEPTLYHPRRITFQVSTYLVW